MCAALLTCAPVLATAQPTDANPAQLTHQATDQAARSPNATPPPAAPAKPKRLASFRDPDDGKLDASTWLLDRKGALPVPVIVTEPAVGYGGGLALLFFRRPDGPPTRTTASGQVRPITPDIFGVVALETENGTQGYGLGAVMHFRQDRWRYRGLLGRPQINLDYYIDGPGPTRQIAYTIEGTGSLQQVQRRIGEGDLYLGLKWLYLDLQAQLDIESDAQYFEPREFGERNSGLGLLAEMDVRDNSFTPSSGWIGALEGVSYAKAFGSDTVFETYRGKLFAYWPLADGRLVLGGRVDVRAAQGDVPFYMQPFVELRGIPAVRYEDRRTAVLEAEARWNLTPRWALVGFAGAGRAWGRKAGFGDTASAVAKGAGFRYLIARRMGLYAGLDYGWGAEDEAVYVTVGSAWR
ncbi:BamA/TamA family outer membrane protein [Agrilutibacter solisilvae]|uniref:Bacterial surface antigen (D15) domain-containing protein n=1 Tax=Agrilutibacter solisilvae TaxID=2763317 RepID=A0A974XYC7_9GAMM|nr:hypothetical protein [Lysobacter solisilvae]QSX77969.1 hypothetical protein I8J32_014775 [Lysobacter solisilvae]